MNEVAVKARCEQIKKQMDETESTYDKEKLQERLAKLAGGVAVSIAAKGAGEAVWTILNKEKPNSI